MIRKWVLLAAALALASVVAYAPAAAAPGPGPGPGPGPAPGPTPTVTTGPAPGPTPAVAFGPRPGPGNDATGGWVPDGQQLSPFDLSDPAVNRLDPALLNAVVRAARAAAAANVSLGITAGWRSVQFQQTLFDEAVIEYGSGALASQYVASPLFSKHVLGKAVDIGPAEAAYWLSHNSAPFGLCQIYAQEIWHFELASDYGGTCPPLLPFGAG